MENSNNNYYPYNDFFLPSYSLLISFKNKSGGKTMDSVPDLYPLTSLQIGDVQSYLSQAFLFFAHASDKFLILVDNHSWRMNNNHSTTIHLKELFATKYRTSPFKNTRALIRRVSARYKDTSISSNDERKKLYKWVSVVNSRRWRATALFSLVDLHVALHGFIVFEVSWNDIRGINYYSELQTDTSMAFELKSMKKWDFHSIHQAYSSILSWFSGSAFETRALFNCLLFLDDKVPSHSPRKFRVSFKDLVIEEKRQAEITPKVDSLDVKECTHHVKDTCYEHQNSEELIEPKIPPRQHDLEIESMNYKDTLLKFYFNDRDLPYRFKEKITSDLKLLTLLETGLPSWVIFLQSYPLFCKIYRPWMRPLVRTLYILISLVTCMIGFYDLYKNVPLLKATASHVLGPFFNWIEDWDMISRVRYLGTMLFIQNFEKAMRWSLKLGRVLKVMLLLVTKPLIEPLQDLIEYTSPVWILLYEAGTEVYQAVSSALMAIFDLIVDLFELLFSPFQILYSYLITIAALFKPIFDQIWQLCRVPVQLCSKMGNQVAFFGTNIYKVLEGVVMVLVNRASGLGQMASGLTKAKPTTTDVSMWNSIWKDLLSKVFRSLRSIMYGLIAFLDTCNRHRLSTSNHIQEYIKCMSDILSSKLEQQPSLPAESCQKESSENHEHVD